MRGQHSSKQRRDRHRAAIFRRSQETTRVIELIDAEGNREFVRQHGRLGVTKHTKILSALEKRALRYRRKGQKEVDQDEILYNEALDETGTVATACLTDSDDESWGDEPSRVPIYSSRSNIFREGGS